jgi:yecA family protein
MQESLTYDDINQAIENFNLPLTAAEIHGYLCGYICIGKEVHDISWLKDFLGEGIVDKAIQDQQLAKQANVLMLSLYHAYYEQLKGLQFEFQLLLPDDEQPLRLRAETLGQWCQSFLTSLRMLDPKLKKSLSPDCQDALEHIQEIAKLDYAALETNEEDEKAFFEVSEYVRMAVLTLYSELQRGQLGNESSEQLH